MTYKINPPQPGEPDTYEKPSPHVPTIQLEPGGHFINAEYSDDEDRSKRPPGESHRIGTCGGYAGLCGQCWELELNWHIRIARRIAAKSPPQLGENVGDYCRRVRGRMVDTWHEAFSRVIPARIP